ncbi:Mesothelin-like protein [Dissostichus eleginoides]|uniref:Mesothelin-like protein n=1 Tax=Dissostichus eleginoides TaxID=100907 RepID=A0AAD9BQB2_DISEL|nr:Mesothelin-like protein [Dissostichus eleginoides]
MVFSGLEVLHLLSPVQKAELLLRPEVASLDNGTLSLVFHSMMTGDPKPPPPTQSPGWGNNWTTPGYPNYSPNPTHNPYQPPSPHNSMGQVVNGFMMAFKPIGSFVHDFVSFTQERESEIRSTTLTQFMLNWTLAELADMYRPKNTSMVPEMPDFDVTNVEDWFQYVVMPVLQRVLPEDLTELPEKITLAFHQVFHLDNGMYNETSEIQDVCSIRLDEGPCGLTDAVENVAKVLHCAARSNLTLSEEEIMRLIVELTERLNMLIKELTTVNFKELAMDFQQIFSEAESPSLTPENLEDPAFIKLWFNIKLVPLLPNVHSGLLSCLSTKNFSCPVYQTIVAEFSKHETDMYPNRDIYEHFIFPFLMHHNTSDPQCVSSANSSAEWLMKNFGVYSRFSSITDFYKLNPWRFFPLSPKQIAGMLLLPLPTPPEKDVVIDRVFDFLFESPEDARLPEVLHELLYLIDKVNPPCDVYRQIFERLYGAIPDLPRDVEPFIWSYIDQLINVAPEECVPQNLTCPDIKYNSTHICKGVDSSALHSHLNSSKDVSCNFTLETFACAQLEDFSATHLVSLLKCNLPGNSSHSSVLWKILLTKLSSVLDPALDMLAGMPMPMVGPSASEVLDVLGEIRVSLLTDEELMNSSVIRKWFSQRLSAFLPFTSGRFLHCLTYRNLSCHSYQQILQVFIHHFDNMTSHQQHVVLKDFILRFMSHPHSGPGCVSASNSSAEWLMKNVGPFSRLLSIKQLLHLNPHFNPLEALRLLTPLQTAELLLVNLPSDLDKDAIINVIFDFLTESPDEKKLQEFLMNLAMLHNQANFTCSSYKTLYTRMDMALSSVSVNTAHTITYIKMELSKYIPPGCIIYSGQCNVTMTNETDICVGVNSTKLQLSLNSGQMLGGFCDFSVEEYACASLSGLKAEHLAEVLMCDRSSNSSSSRPVWKLLLSKASHVLDKALDLLPDKSLDPRNPAVSMILDSIREIRLDMFDTSSFNSPALLQLWFQRRLRPFLPAVSPEFLSCLTTKGLNCNSYQLMVKILSSVQPDMTRATQMSVVTHFIKAFLTRNNTADPSCSAHTNNSAEWLQRNLGGFSVLLSVHTLQTLYPDFTAMEALPELTVRQLAEVSSTPGQLTSPADVAILMKHVPDKSLPAFFDDFSPAIMGHESMFPSSVRSALLQMVFDRANLSDPSVGDSEVMLWLHDRLRPLLVELLPRHVAPFFRILEGRKCSIEEQGVTDLNSTISSLSEETQEEIYSHIVQSLKGPIPLKCYGENYNQSFYGFLQRSFMSFQFPNLTTFLSLMPHNRMHQLVNSMPLSHLGDFLRRPDVVDNDAELCTIYDNYVQTPMFLETESLPAAVRRPTLPCVWPMALSSSERSEVDAWFDRRLPNYLMFLTETLISPDFTHNASCLAFQKLVSVLGDHNYTAADFMRRDVFTTIRSYLTSATVPRCYNTNDPELNSTAWFAEYIGPFMPFLTLEDLLTFGSTEVLQVFTVNPLNIALLNHSALPQNLTDYYTELVYLQDGNFNPLLLPLVCRCVAPGTAFLQLTAGESIIVLHNLTTLCTDLDPQVSAALASNFGDDIDATDISVLGNESNSLSVGQLSKIKSADLLEALATLSMVTGWNEGQAKTIIMSLISTGAVKINSSSSLLMLGSLIVGIPSKTFGSISGSQLLTASKNPSFLQHITTASSIVQQTFVNQIISVNTNSEMIIQNIPDELAQEIPRARLLGLSGDSSVLTTLNKKKWKRQQAELFFGVIAVESATTELGSVNNLSSSVLQGFTCTGVRTFKTVQIKKLIKACRRKGKRKVTLVETQLTCMYNYIKNDSDATIFNLFPPDMLMYYDYSLVPEAMCRSYFEQLSDADFSVFSSDLSYQRSALFDNARSCLNITNTSLTEDNVSVLGNMCCVLDGSYIENSDPSILEKLNNCPALTDAQAAAVVALLQGGKTQYGAASTWTLQTLKDLEMLPLYLTSSFYDNFNKKTKRRFLKYFLTVLKSNGVSRKKRKSLKKEIRKSIRNKSKRSVGAECTVGEINQVIISDETFPFDYDDITQFNCCLSASTVKNNLDGITDKVDDKDYLKIVLSKLHEAYSSSDIPEDQVQLLGPASRVATVENIDMWTITQIDTLSSLMDSENGEWDSSLVKAIVSKYLSTEGNSLGSTGLNSLGGTNLCFLDVEVQQNISSQSLKEANALTVSSCTLEKKKALFTIAKEAFDTNTRATIIPTSTYQLIEPYMGGADLSYVKSLSTSDINMNMATFTALDENVILDLTVNDVKGLLGTNLANLKSYENQTPVQTWISQRFQTDLDTLEIGLTGGRAGSATTGSPTTGSATTGSATTGSATTGSPTTGSATTGSATTGSATTGSPTTGSATTGSATTGSPTTGSPTTGSATTGSATTGSATTGSPTTGSATTGSATTGSATTGSPTTGSPTTSSVTTGSPNTGSPTTAKAVTTKSPSITTKSPNTPTQSPITTKSPSITTKSPNTPAKSPITTTSPSITTKSPSITTKSPNTPPKSPTTTKSPSITTKSPNTPTQSPITTKSPSITTKSPNTPAKSPITTTSPSITTKSPSITTKSPNTPPKSPTTTKSPSITTKSPSITTKSPSITTKAPTTTTKAPTTTTDGTSTGAHIRAEAGVTFSLLFALFIASLV